MRFALIYIAGGIFSMVTSALFAPQSVTVGASGALFGLLGAYLAELITNCHLLSVKEGLCAFASLFFSIAINLAIGLLPVRKHELLIALVAHALRKPVFELA